MKNPRLHLEGLFVYHDTAADSVLDGAACRSMIKGGVREPATSSNPPSWSTPWYRENCRGGDTREVRDGSRTDRVAFKCPFAMWV